MLNIHTIKPIDADAVIKAASETGALVTAENHNVIGGLGSAVAEVLAEQRPTPLERVGVKDRFGQVGKAPHLMGVFRHHRRGHRQGGPQGHRQKVAAPGVPPEPSRFTGFTVSLPARPGGLEVIPFSDSSKDWIWIP